MAREKPIDDRVQLTLRLPADLHETLVSNLRSRSLNADIVERLWQSVELGVLGTVMQPPIQITLDTNGRPTNWAEVTALAAEISDAFKSPINAISIEVLTPEMQKAHQRRQDDFNAHMGALGFERMTDND